MNKHVVRFARCCAAAAVVLVGAGVSEAAPITLVDGASSVELCLPGLSCGSPGLSNWIADGGAVTGFQQWFDGGISSDPGGAISWSGALDTLSTPSWTHTTPDSATVSFFDAIQKVGITIDYELAELGGVSHILETATLNNMSSWFVFANLSDGNLVDANIYAAPRSDTTLATVDYTPNPEPISMVLLGTGLLAVVRSRRRHTALA